MDGALSRRPCVRRRGESAARLRLPVGASPWNDRGPDGLRRGCFGAVCIPPRTRQQRGTDDGVRERRWSEHDSIWGRPHRPRNGAGVSASDTRGTSPSSGLGREIRSTASRAGPRSSASRVSKSSPRRSTGCASFARHSLRRPDWIVRAIARIQYLAGDGRIFLMHSPAKFDIIEADALRPSSAYSGNLYSEEYFTLMRSRLRPQGLAATWLPTARVHNAFVRVFPYVVSVPGILVGSSEPIAIDRDADPAASRRSSRARPLRASRHQRRGVDVVLPRSIRRATRPISTARRSPISTPICSRRDEYDLSPADARCYAFQFSFSNAGSGTVLSTGRWAGCRSSSTAPFWMETKNANGLPGRRPRSRRRPMPRESRRQPFAGRRIHGQSTRRCSVADGERRLGPGSAPEGRAGDRRAS